jgi:hypothetical protein
MPARGVGLLLLLASFAGACEMVAGIGDRKLAAGGSTAGTTGAGIGGAAGHGGGPGGASAQGGAPGVGGGTGIGGVASGGGATGPGGAAGATAVTGGGGGPASGGATAVGASGGTSSTAGATGTGATGGGGVTSAGGILAAGGIVGQGGIRADAAVDAPISSDGPADATGCVAGVQGTGTGLIGDYFITASLTGLKVTRIDSTIDFNWPGAPDTGIPADGFSVRWTGQVEPRYSGRYTFYTTTDDGARLWVNGVQLVNDWTSHSPTENSGAIDLVAGQKYDIKMEYFEQGGMASAQLSWSSPCQAREVIPASQLYAAGVVCSDAGSGTGTGLKGDYYDNQGLTGFRLSRIDPTISFTWPDGTSPDPTISPGSYSVRWTGQVQAMSSGPTTFYVASDDGVRLFIDDALVIDDWSAHATTEDSVTLTTVAGQKYNLRLEYFEQSGGGTIQLRWSSGCQVKDFIPQAQLYPTYTGLDCTPPGSGIGIGLRGEYFNNMDFTSPATVHPAEVVNFDWGAGSPDPAVGPDTFSARWTGKVLPLTSGTTSFHTWSDDGVRLWVNGQIIIDNWNDHQAAEDIGNINLVAGQLYDIRLEYRENLENALIKLEWATTCQPADIIPASQLYPPGYPSPDAGSDTPPDVAPDVAPDAGPDTMPDLVPDLAADVPEDTSDTADSSESLDAGIDGT